MSAWLPIESAPKDGSEVLLLYPSGRVEMGRWEHSVRTVNGRTVSEYSGWTTRGWGAPLLESADPIFFAHVPALPPRDEQGYVSAGNRMEAPRDQ